MTFILTCSCWKMYPYLWICSCREVAFITLHVHVKNGLDIIYRIISFPCSEWTFLHTCLYYTWTFSLYMFMLGMDLYFFAYSFVHTKNTPSFLYKFMPRVDACRPCTWSDHIANGPLFLCTCLCVVPLSLNNVHARSMFMLVHATRQLVDLL